MPNYNEQVDLRGRKVKDSFNRLLQQSSSLVFDCNGFSVETLLVTSSYSNQASYAATSSYSVTSSVIHITSASYAESTSYVTSSIVATNNQTSSVFNQPFDIYHCLFFNYLLSSELGYRGGNIVVLYTTSSISMNETCTTDIGDLSGLHIIANLSSSFVNVSVVNNTNSDATFKYHCDKM